MRHRSANYRLLKLLQIGLLSITILYAGTVSLIYLINYMKPSELTPSNDHIRMEQLAIEAAMCLIAFLGLIATLVEHFRVLMSHVIIGVGFLTACALLTDIRTIAVQSVAAWFTLLSMVGGGGLAAMTRQDDGQWEQFSN